LLRFHGDAAASAVEEAAINYQAPSIIAAGANAQTVSVLATLVNLCLSLICVKAPAFIERLGQTKRGAIILSFSNLVVWVPLIFAFLFSSMGITPVWLALLWLINVMPSILLSFQKDNWLSNVVPQNTLGRYLGQRLAIKSAFYLGAFVLLGYLLDTFGGKSLVSFGFLFIVALVMATVDFVIFTHMRDTPKTEPEQPTQATPKTQFGLFNFIGELKEKKLDMFITFTAFFYLTVGLSGPLYAVYMLEEKHFTYFSFTIIIAAEYLARVISAPFWGKIADKEGNIRVLGIVSRIIPAIPIAWLFCSNVGYLAFIQILSGVCWGAFDLSTQSYLYKVAPPAKKLRYIVYTRCLILFSTAVGGLMGAYLVKGIFFTFGSRLLTIFMISGFFRAIVVMYLMPKLVDLAVSYGKPKAPPKVAMDMMGKPVASKRGLFYRQVEPEEAQVKSPLIAYNEAKLSEDMQKMHKQNLVIQERLAKAEEAKAEILALSKNVKRRHWAAAEKTVKAPAAKQEAITPVKSIQNNPRLNWIADAKPIKEQAEMTPAVVSSSRRPWYGDAEIHATFTAKKAETALLTVKQVMGRTAGNQGLYHDDAGWSNYLKETMHAVIKESKDRKAVVNPKPVRVAKVIPDRVPGREQAPGRSELPELVGVPAYIR
jgi:hypothetical protein